MPIRSSAVLGTAVAPVCGLTEGAAGRAEFAGLVLGAPGRVLGARRLGAAALGPSAAKAPAGDSVELLWDASDGRRRQG